MSADKESAPLLAGGGSSPPVKNSTQQLNTAAVSLDDALDRIGSGWFQYKLLIICGIANASDAIEIMALSYILPTQATCDFEMTGSMKGWLNSSLFIGMIVGGLFWGGISDQLGRKKSLVVGMLLNGTFGALSGLVPPGHYELFLVFRLVSGIGVGGSIPVVFSYFCEFLPSARRGTFLVGLAAFWMIGQVIAAGAAWAILEPVECPVQEEGITLGEYCAVTDALDCERLDLGPLGENEAWRFFIIMAAMPAFIGGLLVTHLPESPKWLMSKGRADEAEAGLRAVISSNQNVICCWEKLAVDGQTAWTKPAQVELDRTQSAASVDADEADTTQRSQKKRTTGVIDAMIRDGASVFKAPHTRTAVLMLSVWCTLCFGFYGVSLWLPSYYQKNGITTDEIGAYQLSFYVALANFPGNAISLWSVDSKYVGRRWTMIIALAGSAISVYGIMAVKDFQGTLISACFFNGISVAAWNSLNIITTDCFPTHIRAQAFGIMASSGRVASIVGQLTFGELAETNDAIPLILASVALAAGSICAFFLPETTGQSVG